ncbi:hypothetical protein Ocepr_1321 [Oceanithermus profundus DSM 14977]|uniref:Uncharacterized protein n=1 Tax=Oceanithermus profundus (strain DSM 14977 / NBRC 100410 / VKM B-2274 / 506) TaxID=670487 RepID=E4U8U8_OCEP5|nr:hypothetical protein [Oceanithermus profundus]ADR36778.1 hypothetical protein Ocepr_1321 [Oceanithermus profundus DSM 14977]
MTPTKLKGLLVWAALLLSLYWSLVEPDPQGLALALGLLLGAGSLIYRTGVELVVPVALLALAVGVLEVQNGRLAPYLLGFLVGLFAPLGAARWLR